MTELDELDILVWKQEAIKRQSFYCNHLSDGGNDTLESYTYEGNDIIHLKNKLGYILFGDPNFSDDSKEANEGCKENGISTESSGGSNGESNGEASEDAGPIEENDNNFSAGKVTSDSLNFIIKLLDKPSMDLGDAASFPLNERDNDYYQQLVKFVFGHDCQDDLISNFEEDLEEMYSSEQVNPFNAGMGQTPTSSQNPLSSSQDIEEKDGFILYYSDPKQIKQIDHILSQIESCSAPDYRDKGLFVSFIFVIAKIENNIAEFPVIRVLKSNNDQSNDMSYFIDITGRCYDGWDNFLKNNIFPICIYCYPKNGFYTCDEDGNVLIEFGESPESKGLRKAGHYGDIASTIAGFGCAGVALVSIFCPIAAPILIGTSGAGIASGLWSSGRSVYHLVDRKLHGQDLDSREAIGPWLGAATGIFSVASMGALNYAQYLARNGRVLGRAANVVINGVEVANTGLNGVNIGHQIYTMYEEKNLNILDSANLALSLLFFYHSAMKFKTAKQIFMESQKDVISNIENQLSRRQRRAFKKLVRGTTENNLIEGSARVIKTVINLEDPKSYFQGISKVTKMAQKTKSKVAFSEDASGKIKINGKIEAQPDVINSMSSKSKQKIFTSSRKWNQSEKYHKLFKKDVRIISKKENLIFKKNTYELLKKMSKKNKQDIIVNCNKSSNPTVIKNIDRFFNLMKRDKNYEKINSQVKSEAKKSPSELNVYSLSQLMVKVLTKSYFMYTEGKETYETSMKYYEENLKDILEQFIEDVCAYLDKIFNETNESLRTLKHIFQVNVVDVNEFTAWNYFEVYFQKLGYLVPDSDTVLILPQKAGWLYLLDNDSEVRSVFIAPLRISAHVERVWVHAFIKNI